MHKHPFEHSCIK